MIRTALLTTLGIAAGIALMLALSVATPSAARHASALGGNHIYLPLVFGVPSCSVPPTLVGPANGTTLDNLVPLFQWRPIVDLNATVMVLEVATDTSFSNTSLVASISFGPASAIWTNGGTRLPGNLNPSTIYYWRTFVVCGNRQGPYSPTWSLKSGPPGGPLLPPPDLSLPLSGTTIPPNSVTLQWTTVTNALDYLVVWYPASAASSFDFAYVNGTSLTIGPLQENTTYDWYVQARNSYADGTPPNPAWEFSTSSASVSGLSLPARPGRFATGRMRPASGPEGTR